MTTLPSLLPSSSSFETLTSTSKHLFKFSNSPHFEREGHVELKTYLQDESANSLLNGALCLYYLLEIPDRPGFEEIRAANLFCESDRSTNCATVTTLQQRVSENNHLLFMSQYHFTTNLLFFWFGLNQTSKHANIVNITKQPNQSQ